MPRVTTGKDGIILIWDFSRSNKMFKKIEAKLKNPQTLGLWRRLTTFLFMSWISETFARLGARRGHTLWKPLSEPYASFKTSRHARRTGGSYGPYSDRPLTKLGHLKSSFILGAPDNVFRQRKKEMFFGSQIPYAQYHQDPEVEGHPPKREMVFVTEKDKKEMGREVIKWVTEGL